MSKPEQYRELMVRLLVLRKENSGRDSAEEDQLLDEMDYLCHYMNAKEYEEARELVKPIIARADDACIVYKETRPSESKEKGE